MLLLEKRRQLRQRPRLRRQQRQRPRLRRQHPLRRSSPMRTRHRPCCSRSPSPPRPTGPNKPEEEEEAAAGRKEAAGGEKAGQEGASAPLAASGRRASPGTA